MDPKAYDVYIYQHVPKCGGRSFIAVCRKHLHKVADSPPPYPTKQQRAEFQRTKKDLSTLPPRTLLHGHLIHRGIRVFERYGSELRSGKCAVITIIRDPLERALSEYFHRKKHGMDSGTLSSWLAKHSNNICGNLGIKMKGDKPVEDFFLMIGTTERLQDSLNVFASLAGFPTEQIDRINASPREEQPISEKDLASFRKANAEDYALYAYAQRRLDEQVRKIPKQPADPAAERVQTSPAQVTGPCKTLIYQELPKCGGRTFLKTLSNRFQLVEEGEEKLNLAGLTAPAIVHGVRSLEHYKTELQSGAAGLVTLIRDPLARSLAMFAERCERGKETPEGLNDWLSRRKNSLCKILGIDMRGENPKADPYLLIGIYEQMQDTLKVLSQLTGVGKIKAKLHEPSTPAIELTEAQRDLFRRENEKDFALYTYAQRRLAERLEET